MKTLLLLLVAAFAGGCSGKTVVDKDVNAHDRLADDELVVITTTDFHASLERAEGLATVIRSLRSRFGDHMLYLDAGDLFQGTIEGNMSKGRAIVKFYNLLGVDAAAIGNHELDFGPDITGRISSRPGEDALGNLKARMREAHYKWLSSNFVDAKKKCKPKPGAKLCNALGQRTVFEPHAIFQRLGKKICVIGATTPTTPGITRAEFIKGKRFEALAKIVPAEAKFLREKEGCDLVLLTAHAGLLCGADGRCLQEGDRAEILPLLRELPGGTVDAVVAGHNHTLAQEAIKGTPVIQTGLQAKYVGVLHLKGTHESLRARFEPFIPVPEKAEAPDVTEALKPFRDAATEVKNRVVGATKAAIEKSYGDESALGNFVADAIRSAGFEAEGAQFAIVNAGGLRSNLPSGTLTYGDIFNLSPFDNLLAVVDVTGAELKRLLEIALSRGFGLSPISGLHAKIIDLKPGERGEWDRDLDGDGKKEDWERAMLLDVTDEKGQPIQDDAHYKLATLDFLTTGGNHANLVYDHIPKSRIHLFQEVWTRDVIVDYLKKNPMIDSGAYFSADRRRIELIPYKKTR